MLLQIIFWTGFILMAHSYVLYPMLLQLLVNDDKKHLIDEVNTKDMPPVIVLMAVYNAKEIIEQKVRSFYDSNYPKEKLHMFVGTDCCNDGTDELLINLSAEFPSLKVIPFKQRSGKIRIINALYAEAQKHPNFNESILISTDVTAMFHPDCVNELVSSFDEDQTGIVGSNIIKGDVNKEGISGQEKAYYERELKMKDTEGQLWGSAMGVFGACFAIRPQAFTPVPDNFLADDFFITMAAFEKGYNALMNMQAKVYMNLPNSPLVEYNRKVRISTGNFQNMLRFATLLWPFNARAFAYWSHKVIRWLGPFFILGCLLSSLLLAFHNALYFNLFLLQLVAFLIPLIHYILSRMGMQIRIFKFISHFFHMNLGIFVGFFKFLSGVKSSVWEPTRRH
jgi:glycosyltransferase involved in cell wall biosynthesis